MTPDDEGRPTPGADYVNYGDVGWRAGLAAMAVVLAIAALAGAAFWAVQAAMGG